MKESNQGPPIGSHANVIAWLHCKLKKRKSAATAKTMLRRRRLIKLEEQISLIRQSDSQRGRKGNEHPKSKENCCPVIREHHHHHSPNPSSIY